MRSERKWPTISLKHTGEKKCMLMRGTRSNEEGGTSGAWKPCWPRRCRARWRLESLSMPKPHPIPSSKSLNPNPSKPQSGRGKGEEEDHYLAGITMRRRTAPARHRIPVPRCSPTDPCASPRPACSRIRAVAPHPGRRLILDAPHRRVLTRVLAYLRATAEGDPPRAMQLCPRA